MDVLSSKYKSHRDEVLHALDVSKELLTFLTREGLLDIADCVKYQGIADKKRRAAALMKTLTERRTDRAYNILIQCLREAGQAKTADLLTDIGEETQIIAQLQKQLDSQISELDTFLAQEEKRAGVEVTLECGHVKQVNPDAATTSKEVWLGAQESMRRSVHELERCKAVITKLHQDCTRVAETNADLMSQTRDCYLQLSKMIRPNRKSADEIKVKTQTTQELFQLLVEDVHRLMTRKSKALERETEGRTCAIRTLRQLRDWVADRSLILNTLHSSLSPTGNPRFSTSRQSYPPSRQAMKSRKTSPDQSSVSHLPIMDSNSPGPLELHCSFSHDDLPPQPYATSTPRPRETNTLRLPDSDTPHELEVQAISSVLEGVQLLERQLREYVHLEIFLTDKFRHEMRMKQHQKKALGFSSQGISQARDLVSRLSFTGAAGERGTERDSLHRLSSQLERISTEYSECSRYMDKVVTSMAQIEDVETFLKNIHDREQEYRNKMNKQEKKKNKDKSKAKDKESDRKDTYESLVELFKVGHQQQQQQQQHRHGHRNVTGMRNSGVDKLILPSMTGSRDRNSPPSQDLLTKLKLLVANYEIVRLRMLTLEDRFRRELARRERRSESLLKAGEEEMFRLQTLLRESEAEKEKYRRLYDNTKLGAARRR